MQPHELSPDDPLAERLVAYVDGELDQADAAEVERLLAERPELAAEVELLRRTGDLIGALPRESGAPDLAETVRDRAGSGTAAPRGSLLQKYDGRALLLLTGACAIHCRYCFRREYPYGGHVGHGALLAGLEAIAADPAIDEVILSGGDPLVLDDETLGEVLEHLARIPHLRRVRLHSRLPVVLPERITPRLLELCASQPQAVVLVVHVNHAQEIDAATRAALARCRAAGITLLNQAVLLAGINDDADSLAALSETLFEAGVLPYYLHLLDRVAGSAHFEVDETRAAALEAALRARLSGYLVPRFVREVAGAASKVPFLPSPRVAVS